MGSHVSRDIMTHMIDGQQHQGRWQNKQLPHQPLSLE